jgi:hypothetical protein
MFCLGEASEYVNELVSLMNFMFDYGFCFH